MKKTGLASDQTGKLRILYVSQYFPPEMGAPSARVYELSRSWVKQGHTVTVLTGFPNHPTGVLHPAYKRKIWRLLLREKISGVDVVRTWLYPAANQGTIKRCLNYLSFMVSAILSGIFFLRRHDIVIATSPQLLVGVAGYAIARIKKVPFVLEVRDLWPESLAAVEAARKGSLLLKLLDPIATFLYDKADLIVTVTDSFKNVLEGRGIGGDKIQVIKNGIDPDLFNPSADAAAVSKKYGVNGNFVVSYIGTLGMAHKIDTVLEVAERLRSKSDITFLLVGEGAEKERLKRLKEQKGLDNVLFVDQQPREEIPKFIAASHACLVLLRNDALFNTVIPSKMFEFMGAGKPVILGVGGEAKEILMQAEAGIPIASESAPELENAILKLYHNRALIEKLGRNARVFVLAHYHREKLALQYAQRLSECVLKTKGLKPEVENFHASANA